MPEYIVAQNGAVEWFVLRHIGEIYYIIATCVSRDYAQQIVDALNPQPEERLGWDDLGHIAAQRGR